MSKLNSEVDGRKAERRPLNFHKVAGCSEVLRAIRPITPVNGTIQRDEGVLNLKRLLPMDVCPRTMTVWPEVS